MKIVNTELNTEPNNTIEMKNNGLITLPKTGMVRLNRQVAKTEHAIEQLSDNESMADKLLNKYLQEVEKNYELRRLCDTQQMEIEDLKRNQQLLGEVTTQKPKEERERKFEPIGYDKLKQLNSKLKEIFVNHLRRADFTNGLVHILYTLYQLKGKATPEQLFASADLTDISGYRYTAFLRKAMMVEFSPTNKKGYYVMTEAGKQFVQGKICTQEEYCKAIDENNFNVFYGRNFKDWWFFLKGNLFRAVVGSPHTRCL